MIFKSDIAPKIQFKTNWYIKTKLWVAKLNSQTHTCAHTRTCAMCVRKAFWNVCAMCVRAADFECVTCDCNFARFWVKKGPNLVLFWAKFASRLPFCHERAYIPIKLLKWQRRKQFMIVYSCLLDSRNLFSWINEYLKILKNQLALGKIQEF